MKISDLKGLFKKSILTLVSVENKKSDYYEVKMKAEAGFTWTPGEHGIFTLPNHPVEGRKWRVFSVASIPEEGLMIIGTRTGKEISSFKKQLISMKEGDKLSIRGPFGWFKIQDSTSPMVLLAGGIGITPIRSLIKALEKDRSRPIELVYASADYYLFDDEIQAIAKGNDKITIHKTQTNEETEAALAVLVDKYQAEAYFFLSGSKSFIDAMKKIITTKGVKGNRILNDPFIGY